MTTPTTDIARITDGQLEAATLEDAVRISLLSWRRADDEGTARHGWWADAEFGSRLWQLERAKTTPQTLVDAQDFVREALAWMVVDGIASGVTVTAERQDRRLAMEIRIARPQAPDDVIRFADLWEVIA